MKNFISISDESIINEIKKGSSLQELLAFVKRQYKIDQRYLRMARIWSENSYCIRRKVGALIVKDRMIISDGYNGTPSGFDNVCEYVPSNENAKTRQQVISEIENGSDTKTFSYVLHAEANAITKIAKSHNSSDGSTLYVTTMPCLECAKLIIQSGIKRVVYEDDYRIDDGVKLLLEAGIEVDHIFTNVKFENTFLPQRTEYLYNKISK